MATFQLSQQVTTDKVSRTSQYNTGDAFAVVSLLQADATQKRAQGHWYVPAVAGSSQTLWLGGRDTCSALLVKVKKIVRTVHIMLDCDGLGEGLTVIGWEKPFPCIPSTVVCNLCQLGAGGRKRDLVQTPSAAVAMATKQSSACICYSYQTREHPVLGLSLHTFQQNL